MRPAAWRRPSPRRSAVPPRASWRASCWGGRWRPGCPRAGWWVVGDPVSSGDAVRRGLEGQGRSSVLAVPSTHGIWTRAHQLSVEQLVDQLPADAWVRRSAGEGSHGPRGYDWACLRLPSTPAAGTGQWLLAGRSVSEPKEVAYYRVYGPADTPVSELVRVAGRRWTIAEGFEQATGEVGLDQYEGRRYDAWHRHVPLALLAHAYLEVTRLSARSAPADAAPLALPARDAPFGGGASANRAELIPLTVPAVRRLLLLVAEPEDAARDHHLRWSPWRRQHQAVARRGHRARRAQPPPLAPPGPTTPGPSPVHVVPGTAELRAPSWSPSAARVPPAVPRRGRPSGDLRRQLEGLLAVMPTGGTWREVPCACGPWQTISAR